MPGPKRILYIDLAPSVGGSVISLYHLVKGLDRECYEPCVVMRASNGYVSAFRALGVPVRLLGSAQQNVTVPSSVLESGPHAERWSRVRYGRLAHWLKQQVWGERLVHLVGFYLRDFPDLLTEARQLHKVMCDLRPDLVHLNDVVCVSRAGILAAWWARMPALCHLRAMAWRNHFDRWLSHTLRGYICISYAVDCYQRTLGGRCDPSWIVYNGIDLADYEDLPTHGQALEEFGWNASHQVVGCVGRLVRWKGQDVFVRALGCLRERMPQLRGLIVGGAAAHEAEYADELKHLVHAQGLDEQVCFVGHRDDVPQILRAMDVMVHSSVAPEPFGRVLIEAMAAGVAVIGTEAGAVPEIIEDGRTGLLVRAGDHLAMAAAIERALSAAGERRSWQEAARQMVQERFTVADYVAGVECVYEDVLGD